MQAPLAEYSENCSHKTIQIIAPKRVQKTYLSLKQLRYYKEVPKAFFLKKKKQTTLLFTDLLVLRFGTPFPAVGSSVLSCTESETLLL